MEKIDRRKFNGGARKGTGPKKSKDPNIWFKIAFRKSKIKQMFPDKPFNEAVLEAEKYIKAVFE
jgi:hypothetical protein